MYLVEHGSSIDGEPSTRAEYNFCFEYLPLQSYYYHYFANFEKIELPVRVETGLVLFDGKLFASKVANDVTETDDSIPRFPDLLLMEDVLFLALSPSSKPSLVYKSVCDPFLSRGYIGLAEFPSSSTEIKHQTHTLPSTQPENLIISRQRHVRFTANTPYN